MRYVAVSPPSPPPAAPDVLAPPPPSAPPSPPLPAGVTEAAVAGVLLSTLRDPHTFDEADRRPDLVADGYAWPPGYVVDRAACGAALGDRAACLASSATHAVPCVSAVLEANCLDAARKCGTQAANGERPTLELTLATEPRQRRAYLWGLELVLPDTPELAGLLFASIDTGGGRGYRAIVYAGDGSVLNTPSFEPSAAAPDDRRVLVSFAGVGDDAQVLALKDAKYVELVLPGAQRQIWLKRITVYERSLAEAGLLAPQPPEPPAPPPLPGPTRRRRRPSRCRRRHRQLDCSAANFLPGQMLADQEVVDTFLEGCGLTRVECCERVGEGHLRSLLAGDFLYYRLSDGGCCTAVIASGTTTFSTPGTLQNHETDQSGVGLIA